MLENFTDSQQFFMVNEEWEIIWISSFTFFIVYLTSRHVQKQVLNFCFLSTANFTYFTSAGELLVSQNRLGNAASSEHWQLSAGHKWQIFRSNCTWRSCDAVEGVISWRFSQLSTDFVYRWECHFFMILNNLNFSKLFASTHQHPRGFASPSQRNRTN